MYVTNRMRGAEKGGINETVERPGSPNQKIIEKC